MAVNRGDLNRIVEAVRPHGFAYRHTAGIDMLVDAARPSARSAVHVVAAPVFSPPVETRSGVLLAPVADLVDAAGLITPGIEAGLPDELCRRLTETRSTE